MQVVVCWPWAIDCGVLCLACCFLLVDACCLILCGLLLSLFDGGCVWFVVYGSWFVGWCLLLVVDCFGIVARRVLCVLLFLCCLWRVVWNVCCMLFGVCRWLIMCCCL